MRYACFIASLFFCLIIPVDASSVESVCFVPEQDCQALIVNTIGQARHSVRVQAYGFTSAPIANALIDAAQRGIDVWVIVDKSQKTAKQSKIGLLRDAGITVLIDHRHVIAHNKVVIIDGRLVVTGSFNFTKNALRNAENIIVIDDPGVVSMYEENWKRHAKHANGY